MSNRPILSSVAVVADVEDDGDCVEWLVLVLLGANALEPTAKRKIDREMVFIVLYHFLLLQLLGINDILPELNVLFMFLYLCT